MLFLGCKALSSIFESICLNFYLVHFENGPEFLTRRTADINTFYEICAVELSSEKFSRLCEVLFSSFSDYLMLSAFNIPQYSVFSFSASVLVLS